MSRRFVVIGDAVLDVRAVPSAVSRRGGDVPARVQLLPGGQGANVAVRLARRGTEVELVTALADDAAGAMVRAALEADGVVLRALEAPATGAVVVLADADGERTMISQRTPFAGLVEAADLAGERTLIVSGYLLHEPAAHALCAGLAAGSGRRVLLGCAVPDALVEDWRASAAALRPDLLVLNRDEAGRLATDAAPGVAVTDATGATVSVGGVTVASVTGTAAPARDTTGSGDAFAAALVAELDGVAWPPPRDLLQDAVEAAVALASRVSRVDGAQGRVAGELPARLPA